MFLVGIGGGPAAGKTTLCEMFRDLGVPILDQSKCMIWGAFELCLFRGYQYAVIDLKESQSPSYFIGKKILVTCERDLQLQRLMESRKLSEQDSVELLDDSKLPLFKPDYVVENSGSMKDTWKQVEALHYVEFLPSNLQWKGRILVGVALGGFLSLIIIPIVTLL